MHCKMSRLDESKAVKGKFACEIDIYWASRSITVHMQSHLIFPTVLVQMRLRLRNLSLGQVVGKL